MPEKAIYIGGHSLLWDARCAGIYIGFGVGLVWMFLIGRKSKNLPPLPILLLSTFMFLPMFIDLFSNWIRLREPTNDIRYLTGILFGGALSVYLYPAFITLVFSDGQNHTVINSFTKYLLFLFVIIGAFFVKKGDNIVVFFALSGLSFLGVVGLIVILLGGFIKGIMFRWEKAYVLGGIGREHDLPTTRTLAQKFESKKA
jgi:uncharacterized membrane protein